MAERLTILIAEDNAADRMLLSTIVSRQGHRVITAANGLEAVSLFHSERPQLVLMDALMPVMDGFEAARLIKQASGEELVPLIFLTSLSEGEALVRCLEAGGDDFLAKPYNRVIIEAKLLAMDRLRSLHATVLQQRNLISAHNDYLLNEQHVAKAVFDKVAHSGCLNAANIRYLQSPYAVFSGDLLLAAYQPSGDMHILLGDFTGHGLRAAVGAMPLAQIFYGMTAKGHALEDILREINGKLKQILPVDVFCCATVLHVGFQQKIVKVWNGGLPQGYLLPDDGGEPVPLVSKHLPLGVLDPKAFRADFEVYPLADGDRVFLLTDGVLEAANAQGELFGEARLLEVLGCEEGRRNVFTAIQQALGDFRGEAKDDVSFIEVSMIDTPAHGRASAAFAHDSHEGPVDWGTRFEFRGETLRSFNPLPMLLDMLLRTRGLQERMGDIYSVLVELYSNALEHGVLALDSSLKVDAQGFSEYYRQRGERLATLESGYVRFDVQLRPQGSGGSLIIRVEDSGAGFNAQSVARQRVSSNSLRGRGLTLIKQLSDTCDWSDAENGIQVEFKWSGQPIETSSSSING